MTSLPADVTSFVGRRQARAQVKRALSASRLVTLLDNCEHLLEACGRLVSDLLPATPGLRVLATSREPLGIAGERIWTVPPLSVPDAEASLAVDGGPARYEALTLFADRAAAVQPRFTINDTNEEEVARLCQQLDGLPLAIELAAVRVRALSVGQILAHLEDHYRLLTAGSRAGAPHRGAGRLNSATSVASVALSHLGMVVGLLGNTEQAIALCDESAAVCDAHGDSWTRSVALWHLAVALWRKGDIRQAREHAKEALRKPAPPIAATSAAADSESVLTKREREVAALVARGMTNKDIATELVISQRTAEAHIEHILCKLGFTSRTQIAAWAAAVELLSGPGWPRI